MRAVRSPLLYLSLLLATASEEEDLEALALLDAAERVALKDVFGARRVFRISMTLMVFTGLLFSLLTYFGAGWLIEWQFIRDPRAYMAVVALSPTIFFVTLLASSRGYLQGWQRMTPTAVSQIIEQIFRVLTMVLFASLLLPMGIDYAAAGASLGAFAGAIGGLLVLVYYHWKLDKDIEREYGPNLAPPPGCPQVRASPSICVPSPSPPRPSWACAPPLWWTTTSSPLPPAPTSLTAWSPSPSG